MLGILAVQAAPALGQGLPRTLPGDVQPGRVPLPALPTAPSDNEFDFSIQQPGKTPVPRAADELVFTLRDVVISGATRFSAEQLRPLYADLLGHDIKLADIQAVADAIETKYHEAGFTLTRAFIPPQRVGNGVFNISVVEGFVKAIDVEGGDPATQQLIKSYLGPVLADRPLQISTMERALLLANDIPGVTASGLLRPSPDEPGASDLVVTVARTAYSGSAGVDNRGSNFAGPWILHGEIAANGLLDPSDQLYANFSSVPDSLEKVTGLARYVRPVGANGMTVSVTASGSYGEPGFTLTPFNLVTSSWSVGPRVHYPLLRSRAESLYLDGGFTWQDAKVTALSQPFSHDKWRVADASINYVESGFLSGVTSLTAGISQGLRLFGASRNGSPELSRGGAHTDFTKLTGSIRRGQALDGPLNLALTLQGQYALAPLLAGEQIAFGGDTIGRGYDPSVLQGDHGFGGSLELRYDFRFDDSYIETAQPYTFFDAGEVWNVNGGVVGGQSLASVGFGVRVTLPHDISGGLEFAQTLSHLANNDNGRLTSRVLFNAAVRF